MKWSKKILNRYTVLLLIMLILFSVLGAKLYYLQVSRGDYYSDSANTKSHKLITVQAPRGFIKDKNGVDLATDVQSYNITYTNTDESEKTLFQTLQKVFKILDENKESQDDNFELKINPYRFEFSTSDATEIQTLQLRFLKDRGFQDNILKKDFKGKKEADLTDSEKAKLNDKLLKLTPEYIYNELIKEYGIIKGLKSINVQTTPENIRRYLLIKDGIKMNSFSGYKPVDIASNISKNTSLIFAQRLFELPGINVDNKSMRKYPYGQLASSVLGYISKINSDDEEKYSEKGYDTSSDYIGISGIEAALESKLKGDNGGKVVQVDKQGRVTNELATREAAPGNNVQLTIDVNLQYAAEQALKKEMAYLQSTGSIGGQTTTNATRGAAVVVDVHTGNVLALVSLPGFDPNDFSNPKGLTDATIQKYFNDDYEQMAKAQNMSQSVIDFRFPIDTSIKGNTTIRRDRYDYFPKPLYNYATMSLIPPGSTFKPLTAVAGLENGAIDENTPYNDQNQFDIGGKIEKFTDAVNGELSVVRALQVSSNPFFMYTAQRLLDKNNNNLDILAQYAWGFGLGADPKETNPGTGIEISESFGQVYNTVSQKKISSAQYLLSIEQDLNTGISSKGIKLQQVDLYDRDGDDIIVYKDKKLSEIKKEIKDDITDSVRNGTFSVNNYKKLLKELIAADPKYSGKNFSDTDLSNIVADINDRAIASGNWELSRRFNVYHAAIGQGMDTFTPLQLAGYVSTLVNGGTRYKLNLLGKITDATGKIIYETKPEVLDKVQISQKTRNLVMQGMNDVTQQGTAAQAFVGFPLQTGGKTGTAQFNADLQYQEGRSDYGIYVGYAPKDDPQIAVSVAIFDGGAGVEAAKVAKGIYEGYFKDELQKKYNYNFDIDLNTKPEN
ncbi:penicillin-binding protein 2 [Clostridium acidisoli DSM 12555]|uniref:Penicillin-binding protein 2 n=1 Tax=Clostridium acidisoli DSM 12555 TaxID=1121291 RepID=A0A1W1X5J2_9CLOT|nr:penicillin-binding transpeptidase domain-containing protein [Clostridium acidisoli]SMC19127.1 penicillin-binding protein 2 [Clostridium acidisoli DSM 12555]